jgi:hypothetical protein
MDFEIYKITRPSIDDAVYYGQHSPNKRNRHIYMGSGRAILMSLSEYGKEAHQKEILCIVHSSEEADRIEKKVIAEALVRGENLLNADLGGQKTRIRSKETRLKISVSCMGRGKGTKLSKEHKAKILFGLIGRPVTQRTREKLREINRENATLGLEGAKPVICIDTGKQYYSISEASRDTGICISSIARCANGERKQTKGTHWAYA